MGRNATQVKYLALISALFFFLGAGAVNSHASEGSATLTPQQFREFRRLVTDAGQHTGSLEVQNYRFSGKLGGCGLVFTVVLRDWAHAPEALTYALGSVTYFAKADQAPYLATKLVIDDFREIDGEIRVTPARAEYSYLRTDSISLAGQESRLVFDEGGNSLLGAYSDPDGSLLGMLANPSITFAYNRGGNGADVEFVLNTVDPTIGQELPMCMVQLISNMQERME